MPRHCPFTLKETAESYVLGHLPPAEAQAFATHLKSCHECRQNVAGTEEFRRLLRRAVEAQSRLRESRARANVLAPHPSRCGQDE